MTLSQAQEKVRNASETMNARYGKVVFDEWAIVSLQRGKERIAAYHGSRRDHFQKNFVNDLGGLRAEVLTTKHLPGHFDFARTATGTGFEAFVCAGDEMYLIFNNTQFSMNDIAKETRWLEAQKAFAELTESLRSDPITT